MNKFLVALGVIATFATIVFAQGLGGVQVPGGPGEGPRQGLGQMMRTGGGSGSVAASEKYVYVLQGGTLYQYSADGLRVTGQTRVPTNNNAGEGGRGEGGGGRGNRNNPPVN